MDMTSVYAEITKTAPQEDGSLLVYGNATDSTLDMDQQICDPAWLKTAMPAWFRYGNIREQHDAKRAVGKATEYEATGDGKHMITAKIVDPVARAKVEAGVFTGFSIGIKNYRTAKSAEAKNGTLISGDIVEISLVDRPCNPNATLTVCKAAAAGWEGSPADLDEELGLVKCEELAFDVAEETVEKTTDVDHLEAPAPGQVCADCNEDGHLNCGPTDKAADTEVAPEGDSPDVVKTVEEAQRVADDLLELSKGAADEITIVEFDREAAKALVEETLTKSAANGLGQDESGDISGADQAIALIAQLVISEAQDLAKMPSQGCDIHLLMSAVDALRCFSKREQIEQAGSDPDVALLAAGVDAEKAETVEKGKYTAEQKRQMLKDGHAMKGPDGEPDYPIADEEDLKNAIHAVGRGKGDHSDIRAYIVRRAKMMGKISEVPSYWTEAGLAFAPDADAAKTAESAADPELVEALGEFADTITEKAVEATKTAEPEAVKAVEVSADPEALVKALTAALEKADNPLRKLFVGIVEASTETTAKSLSELGERLVKVESMATPGGPSLRRTEVERTSARRNDLALEAAHFRALAAANSGDENLRKGYTVKAAQVEAQIKAL